MLTLHLIAWTSAWEIRVGAPAKLAINCAFYWRQSDAVIHKLHGALAKDGQRHTSSRTDTRELLSVTLHIARPRAGQHLRNRGKPFSGLGELT